MNGLSGLVDAGLADRFRRAAPQIQWRTVPRPKGRIAHLNDEEARVAPRERDGRAQVTVDAGPVGALVLLLEIDARGAPSGLWTSDARSAPFRGGAFIAAWGDPPEPPEGARPVPLADLVGLARYALA